MRSLLEGMLLQQEKGRERSGDIGVDHCSRWCVRLTNRTGQEQVCGKLFLRLARDTKNRNVYRESR